MVVLSLGTVEFPEAFNYGTVREWNIPTLEIPSGTSLSTRSEEGISKPKKGRFSAYISSQADRTTLIGYWKNRTEVTLNDGNISVDCLIANMKFDYKASLSDKQTVTIEVDYLEEERTASYTEDQGVSIALGESVDVVEYGSIGIPLTDRPQSGFQGWFKDENAKGVAMGDSQVVVSGNETP